MSKAIFCIATGSSTYMQLALNLGLSIKANSEIETVLFHTNDAMADLGWDERTIDRRFGYAFDCKVAVTSEQTINKSPLEQAHYLKLSCYEMALEMGYDEVIILDADTIILPSKTPQTWFDELSDVNFSAYCNAEFDFSIGKPSKEGYTFWCEPLDAAEKFGLKDKMPQINASFIYFKKSEEAQMVFDGAMDIWKSVDEMDFEFEKHNGSKTEEMCFNISCAVNQIYPHTIPYQPIYFQYQHEENSPPYVAHYFNAISMAGNIMHTVELCAYYTQLSRYYRSMFGINESFVFSNETKKPKDSPIELPFKRRTIWRAGELPNSDAGAFNPSGLVKDGHLYTIFRKEKSMDLYKSKHEHSTAVPHLCTDGNDGIELGLIDMPIDCRCEDFRLFAVGGVMFTSHTIVSEMTNDTIYSKMAISTILPNSHLGNTLCYFDTVALPVKKQLTEKNWVFFGEYKAMWCIYSLNPYKIFFSTDWKVWQEFEVKQPNIKWWQHNRAICNSTNPIKIDDSYFVMFHTKSEGIYSHGVALLDKYTKNITHYTRNGIKFEFCKEGFQKNLLYVSGAIYLEKENIIRIYAGEGDSHSVYFDFDKDVLISEIKKYKV